MMGTEVTCRKCRDEGYHYCICPEAKFARPDSLTPGSDCARLFDALADGEWHTSAELYRLHMIVHSRLSDLRHKHGCEITTEHVRGKRGAEAYRHKLLSVLSPEGGMAARPVVSPSDESALSEEGAVSSHGPHPSFASRPSSESAQLAFPLPARLREIA